MSATPPPPGESGRSSRSTTDDARDAARFAGLAAGLVDVLYTLRLEPDMDFEYVSPSVEAMVGYTPQEHYDDPQLGMRLLDPRDLDVLIGAVQAPNDEPVDMTVRWVAKDGRLVWTHHRCIKQRRSDGSLVLYGAARDVTEHYEATERYRLLAENGTDVVVVSSASDVVEWVSDSITELLGWQSSALIGKSTVGLFHLDDQQLASSAAQGSASGETGRFEARIRMADGTERWMSVIVKPMVDDSGAVVGRIEGWRDVHAEHETREALAIAQKRFRMMVENATDVVFHSIEGITEWVSPSLTSVTGWLPEELIGGATAHLWHPDDREKAIALRDATYAGRVGRDELRYRRKDGSYIWLEVVLQPFEDADGRVGAVGIMRDVNDRVNAQRALSQSESLYRDLAENMSDVVYRIHPDGRILWVSPSVQRALGWTPHQLLETLARDLVHPDDLDRARRARERAIAKSLDQAFTPEPIELRYRTADGPYVWMSVRGHVLLDDDGLVVGGISALRDIDLKVATREALRISEVKYRQLADMVLDMVITFDVNGFADYVSPSVTRVLGWEPEQFAAQVLEQLVDEGDIEAARAAARMALESHQAQALRLRALTASGDRRWVDVTLQARPEDEGGLVVAIRDIDDTVRAEEQRSSSERILRAALANAPSGMCVVGRDGSFLMVNAAMCRILGRDEPDMLRLRWQDVTYPGDIDQDRQLVASLFSGAREDVNLSKRYVLPDGSIVRCRLNVAAVRDATGAIEFFVSQLSDTSDPSTRPNPEFAG